MNYPEIPAGFFFKSDSYWNTKIDEDAAIDPKSEDIIKYYDSPGAIVYGECTMPYNVVDTLDPSSFVTVTAFENNADYKDPVTDKFPNGKGMAFQNGDYQTTPLRDHHLLVADLATNSLYETYQLREEGANWVQEGCAYFKCDADTPRPTEVWQASSDAAGFAVLPGLIRRDEVIRGLIPHALRITVRQTWRQYVSPATHGAVDPNRESTNMHVPMGARFRLRKGIHPADFDEHTAVIITCLKEYGAYVADNGTNFGLSASWENAGAGDFPQFFRGYREPDPGHDNGTFHLTDKYGYDIRISDFELIKLGETHDF